MQRLTSVFVRGLDEVGPLLALLERLFNASAKRTSEETGIVHRFILLDLQVDTFCNHGLVDDCGIEFEKFPIEIDFQGLGRLAKDDDISELRESLALFIATVLSRQLSCHSLVVDNLQTQMAIVEPGGRCTLTRTPGRTKESTKQLTVSRERTRPTH